MFNSGRRESVLIFCASAVKESYMSPVRHYCPDSVHVFLSNRGDELSKIEAEMFESCRSDIKCDSVIVHEIDTSDYNAVLGELIAIKNNLAESYGDCLDIYLNISSGTHEFSAAAMFASMIPKPCIAFRVTNEYGIASDRMREIIEVLNSSTGTSMPSVVTRLQNENPDEEMVAFLRIVGELLEETRYPRFRTIIERLKECGLWSYDPGRKSGFGKTSLEDREERYLKRHYLATALEYGWLERESSRLMKLTDKGRTYLSVYRINDIEELDDHSKCICAPMDCMFEKDFLIKEDANYDRYCRSAAFEEDYDIPLITKCHEAESNSISVKSGEKTYKITLNLE